MDRPRRIVLSDERPPMALVDEAATVGALLRMGFTESDGVTPKPYPTFSRTASGHPLVCLRPLLIFYAHLLDD